MDKTLLRTICLLSLSALLVAACQPIHRPVEALPTSNTIQQADDTDLFAVGDRKLFLHCEGTGQPTVILEAGLGGDHTTWALVQPAAAKLTRVCSYDRAGLGESDPATTPRSSADVVADLHSLLAVAGENAPYILVGHSFGGLHVRLFATTYPDEVAGVLLVDTVHEDWWRRGLALLPAATTGESPLYQELRRYFASEGGDAAENAEEIDIAATAAELRASGGLGAKPLIILVAGIPDLLPAGLPAELRTPLSNLLQNELPNDLVKLSPNSIQVDVPNSGHNIPTTRPDVVIAGIKTLVEIAQQ